MKCAVQNFTFEQTNAFSKIIIDYINNDERLSEFVTDFPSINDIEKIIETKQKESIDRKLLVQTIFQQYQHIEIDETFSKQIHALEDKQTFCIVTAHQLNIFGGPLYYIYKIAQTIATCNLLQKKYPSYQFVPIYWLGSEDHDFEEINHTYLYNKKIEWTDKQGGIIGNYDTASLQFLIEVLENLIKNQPFGKKLSSIFKDAYASKTLAEATRNWLHKLFGQYGLIVVDGNEKAFKQACSDIIKDDILQHSAYNIVAETIHKMEQKGYKHQAMPRQINLFYIDKNSRERIEFDAEKQQYFILNTDKVFSKEEILSELKNYPEKFSPNVILRPLFQQKILPSLMYIGGGGEIAYWLQLKNLFDKSNIAFPQLIVRNSALIITRQQKERLEKLNIPITQIFHSLDDLKNNFIRQEKNISIEEEVKNIEQQFAIIQEKIKEIDASLVNYVGAEAQKTFKSTEHIEARIHKALKQKNETSLNQMEKIKNQLFPNNNLQERVDNFSAYYADFGQQFIEMLIAEFDVYQKQFLVIELM